MKPARIDNVQKIHILHIFLRYLVVVFLITLIRFNSLEYVADAPAYDVFDRASDNAKHLIVAKPANIVTRCRILFCAAI